MPNVEIPELNTHFVFKERPESIPGDLRPLWRIGSVLLMLYIASRAKKSSFGRLHVLNWALRSDDGRDALLGLLDGRQLPGTVLVRIEPSLNRAVDFAHAERLLVTVGGNRIELTSAGEEHARRILDHDGLLASEIEYLQRVGKRLTEALVDALFGGAA